MSNLITPVVNVVGQKIVVNNHGLVLNPIKTFLTSDTASASGTLTVKNIVGFAINQVLIIGELNNEGSEIIKTHASTAPTGSTITLASNTLFPHSSGTPVYLVDYDNVVFDNGATSSAVSLTTVGTVAVASDGENTLFDDVSGHTGYYFARYWNSITSVYSNFSSAVPIGGYGILTARSIIDNALGMIDKLPSNLLTDTYSFQQINNCQMEVIRELKRWSFLQVFDYNLGQITTGQCKVALPTDIDDTFSNKSLYNFRIGTLDNLTWIDKEKWNEITWGVAHTTNSVAVAVSDSTITLTDASDFSDSGTLYIGANTYVYSSVNRTTNVVTLSSVSTTTNVINSDVFSGATFGIPQYYGIWGGNINFYPVLGSTYTQRDGHLDYYKAPVSIINDSDTIVLPDPTIIQYYLAWKLVLRQNSGRPDSASDGFYNNYVIRREKLKQKEVLGKTFKLKPVLNVIDENSDIDDRSIRTGNFPSGL